MRNVSLITLLLTGTVLAGCSLAPDFTTPDVGVPQAYKEQLPDTDGDIAKGKWKEAHALESSDRGQWWKIFGDEKLNALEEEAIGANQSLRAAAARVEQSRAFAQGVRPSYLPDLDIGANAVRAKPPGAALAAFGTGTSPDIKPYNLFSGQGVLSYEADLFGAVRDNYKAYLFDSQAQEASYRSALLALQADVAQYYYSLRALDAERKLLRDTIAIRTEANRIMQRRYEVGSVGEAEFTRTQSELSGVKAELILLDSQRRQLENAMAVLLGKMPSEYSFAEAPLLEGAPPVVPAGLPSDLLQRRPDITAAVASMEAANKRIGVARTAFFPRLILTASGGFQSTELGDLFQWSSRTWALGQTAGSALAMSVFNSGRNFAQLDASKAAYEESVANYRQQVLLAFRDVEDNLTAQRLLAEQLHQQEAAANAATRTTDLTGVRYDQGDVDYFQVVDAQRVSLAAQRAAVQLQGQRYIATVSLVRALGGGWEVVEQETQQPVAAETPAEKKSEAEKPEEVAASPLLTKEPEKPEELVIEATSASEPQVADGIHEIVKEDTTPVEAEKEDAASDSLLPEFKLELVPASQALSEKQNASSGTVLETKAAPSPSPSKEEETSEVKSESKGFDWSLGEVDIVPAAEAIKSKSSREAVGGTQLETAPRD